MIRKTIITVFIFILIAALPAWLYASGNTPYIPLNSGEIVAKIRNKFPKAWKTTYHVSHGIGELLRNRMNIEVPSSINERTEKILETHQRAIEVCNGILEKIVR